MKLNQSLQSAEMLMLAQTEPRLVQSGGVGGAERGEDGEGLREPGRRGGIGGSQLPPRQAGWREDRALEGKGRTESRTQGW